jgi:hypothetical protein
MATTVTQVRNSNRENEITLSASEYIKAYRPWHSLYNVRLRLETNTGEEVSKHSNGQTLYFNLWSGSVTVSNQPFLI